MYHSNIINKIIAHQLLIAAKICALKMSSSIVIHENFGVSLVIFQFLQVIVSLKHVSRGTSKNMTRKNIR